MSVPTIRSEKGFQIQLEQNLSLKDSTSPDFLKYNDFGNKISVTKIGNLSINKEKKKDVLSKKGKSKQ